MLRTDIIVDEIIGSSGVYDNKWLGTTCPGVTRSQNKAISHSSDPANKTDSHVDLNVGKLVRSLVFVLKLICI